MIPKVLPALLVAAATGTLIAQTVPPVRIVDGAPRVYGVGTTRCDGWMNLAETQFPQPEQVSWAMGYLSASTLTAEVDADYVYSHITGHCTQNPNSTVADAVKTLIPVLAEKQR